MDVFCSTLRLKMQAIRLLIADDHEIFRQGIRTLIQEQEPGWEIAAEVNDAREAVAKARELKPDVAILNITIPLLSGLEASRQIVAVSPHTKVLISTLHDSNELFESILDAGGRGYILKTEANRDLIMAVKALLSNKTFRPNW
jgi:DNA-binding NarL/FixJ family response regulator